MKDVQYFCTSFFETNCVFKSSHTTFAWISCAWYNEKNIERRIAMHDFLIFLAVTVFIFVPLTIGITISLENRSPHKTISWLLVLMFLPGVGFLLYLIFGANTRKHRWRMPKRGSSPISITRICVRSWTLRKHCRWQMIRQIASCLILQIKIRCAWS